MHPEMQVCAAAVKMLSDVVEQRWKTGAVEGVELYRFAEEQATGWNLNLQIKGHRVRDADSSLS